MRFGIYFRPEFRTLDNAAEFVRVGMSGTLSFELDMFQMAQILFTTRKDSQTGFERRAYSLVLAPKKFLISQATPGLLSGEDSTS